ncbi:UNVERIFIED_CONTAM: hypothetical protein LK11_06520 [Mumia flava]
MFDSSAIGDLEAAVARLQDQPIGLATDPQLCDLLRRTRAATDKLEGLEAAALDQMRETRAHDTEGSSSVAGWATEHLRLSPARARARAAAGRTLRLLPDVAAASRSGRIRIEHVEKFTTGLTKLGTDLMGLAAAPMVELASTTSPEELKAAITELHGITHTDELDDAYARGMDRHDLTLSRTAEGFHLSGFLDIAGGMRLAELLKTTAAPRDADDTRTPAQRRLDTLTDLINTTLTHGLPTDHGIRPQLNLHVEAEWLAGQIGAGPPRLDGWGTIGTDLYGYLSCDADRTALLLNGTTTGPTPIADVLNVGRTQRLATKKQRRAVRARQHGRCANPGCSHTVLEFHHVAWWTRDGGPTDLHNIIGLCPRCHARVHTGTLTIEPDGHRGFTFTTTNRAQHKRRLEDHARIQREKIRTFLRRLTRDAGLTPTPAHTPVTPPPVRTPATGTATGTATGNRARTTARATAACTNTSSTTSTVTTRVTARVATTLAQPRSEAPPPQLRRSDPPDRTPEDPAPWTKPDKLRPRIHART